MQGLHPHPEALPPLRLQSPALGKEVGTSAESGSGLFLKRGGNFHRAELGRKPG